MGNTDGSEGLSLQDLAAQMLGLTEDLDDEDNGTNDEGTPPQAGHPAWQGILNNVPEANRAAVMEQLHEWDAGVSRRFQKIHDEYAPLKQLEELADPDTLRQAIDVYTSLLSDPRETWETIGRVYGLSRDSLEEDEEDEDYAELPPALREKLSKLDEHEQVLGAVTRKMLEDQARDEEAQENQALEEYLEELKNEYGDYDEDFVLGLIAAGIDGEEAVERYQLIVGSSSTPPTPGVQRYTQPTQPTQRTAAPRVMSGSGGIPSSGSVDVHKLSNQDTQRLVMEALKLTHTD